MNWNLPRQLENSEKTFYTEMRRICLVQRQTHTQVGTADVGPNTQSILTLETLIPFSNNIVLATSMSKQCASVRGHYIGTTICLLTVRGHSSKLSFPNNHTLSHTPSHIPSVTCSNTPYIPPHCRQLHPC